MQQATWVRGGGAGMGGAAVVLSAILGGCASNPWASEFRAAGATAPALAEQAPVRVREVPWERLQGTLTTLERQRATSDIHPDEWTPEQKQAARSELLRGLQISEDPRSVEILGRSEFRTTDKVPYPPSDQELARFARKIGATTVVWSSSYLGKTEVVRSEPVTGWRSSSWDRLGPDGRWRSLNESETIWMPVVVKADERAFIAYFLRETGGGRQASAAGAGR